MLKVLVSSCIILVMGETNIESLDDNQSETFNNIYAPSTLNFADVYSNNNVQSRTTIAEDEVSSTVAIDLVTEPTRPQFVEFHPDTMTTPGTTIPPPKYILKSAYLGDTTMKTKITTEDPDDVVKVMPIRRRNYQRGVLDLLFPSSRVKSFKNVFDSIRRLLSYTFRRR